MKTLDNDYDPAQLQRIVGHPAVQAVLAEFPDAVLAAIRHLPGFQDVTADLYLKRAFGRAFRLCGS